MSKLIFDSDMVSFLRFANESSIIAAILLNGNSSHLNDEGNYIKREVDGIDVVSFLPKSKYEKVNDAWQESRIKIKIGRLVKKFINDFSIGHFNIDAVMIEKFVNLYKSYFSRDTSKLKIVEGDDILKYYSESNYATASGSRVGTIWNSCMRQTEKNHFMKIYARNPDKVKMLVFFSDDNKVRARALLWQDVRDHRNPGASYKFMDRIYYLYDHDVSFFKDWARDNGYIAKWEQNARTEILFDIWTGEPFDKELYVLMDNFEFHKYPYLDTFKFFKYNIGRLSNTPVQYHDYILVQSNGDLERDHHDDEPELVDDEDDYDDDGW